MDRDIVVKHMDMKKPIVEPVGAVEWYDNDWNYKKNITIDYSQVPRIDSPSLWFSNFTVCVNISNDPDLASHAQGDFDDILFVDTNQTTKLSHSIEYYDATDGNLTAWVKLDNLSHNVNTTFYMYYGNAGCGSQEDPANAWDEWYVAVYHMDDVAGLIQDETSYSNDAINSEGAATYRHRSDLGYGIDFDGNDGFYLPEIDFVSPAGNTFMSTLVYCNWTNFNSGQKYGILDMRNNSFIIPCNYDFTGTNHVEAFVGGPGPDISPDYLGPNPAGNLSYCFQMRQYSYPGVTGACYVYNNGSYSSHDTIIVDSYTGNNTIGFLTGDAGPNSFFDGIIDEIRISNITRNIDWVITEYNSLNNATNNSFYLFSSEIPSGDFPPSNLTAVTDRDNDIVLNWDKHANATHTYVEYNTITSWVIGAGSLLYNDTGSTYTHSGLSCNVLYYYQVWSYNSTSNNFSSYTGTSNISCPGPPTSLDVFIWGNTVNVSWTKNTHADNTLVVKDFSVYPTGVDDGVLVYNGTNSYYNITNVLSYEYFTLYSWNSTVNHYSSGTNLQFGRLVIWVYDENTSLPINNWDVHITNYDKTSTYESLGNNNPLFIDSDDLPYGPDTMIKINATDYTFKVFYMDIYQNNFYSLDAYLIHVNETQDNYVIRIINEVANPVSGAKVYVKKYINDSWGYKNLSVLITDGYGYCPPVSLIAYDEYIVTIVADGYINATYDLHPVPIIYGDERDKYFTFTIYTTETEYLNETMYHEKISFTIEMNSVYLFVNYSDSTSLTEDFTISIFEHNSSNTSFALYSRTTQVDVQSIDIVHSINNSNCYSATLDLNHTIFGYTHDIVGPICWRLGITTKTRFDTLLDLNFKHCPFGWSNLFCFFILLGTMFSFGQRNVGVGMIITGGILAFINSVIGFNILNVFIPATLVALGLLVMWSERGKA